MIKFHHNRIALIYGNDGFDVRVGKICRSLSALSYDVHFIGWVRRPEEKKEMDLGSASIHTMIYPTQFGWATRTGILRFGWHIANTLAKLRPEIVCCVNEDNAFLALAFRRIFYRYLVCDVFDALLDRHSHRHWPIPSILSVITELTRMSADRLIATDDSRFGRFGRFRKKSIVIENVPEDPGDELSRMKVEGPIKVYVAGSLDLIRGLKQIITVAEALGNLQIVSAGWPSDEYASKIFIRHPSVSFHGIVTLRKSLELAAECDAVLAFYAPISVNNRQASPNKVYDAMSVGRPVIINEEVIVSQWIIENKLGFRCSYYDIKALENIILSLEGRRGNLNKFAKRVRDIFVRKHTWKHMEFRLDELYKGICKCTR